MINVPRVTYGMFNATFGGNVNQKMVLLSLHQINIVTYFYMVKYFDYLKFFFHDDSHLAKDWEDYS